MKVILKDGNELNGENELLLRSMAGDQLDRIEFTEEELANKKQLAVKQAVNMPTLSQSLEMIATALAQLTVYVNNPDDTQAKVVFARNLEMSQQFLGMVKAGHVRLSYDAKTPDGIAQVFQGFLSMMGKVADVTNPAPEKQNN